MIVDGEDFEAPASEGVTAEAPAAPDVIAESSPAPDVETSVLDAVKAALKPKEAPSTSRIGTEQSQSETEVKSQDGAPKPVTEEEIKRYSPAVQHRIRELAARDRDFRTEIESLKPKAESFDRITSHLRQNKIDDTEFSNAVEVTRLIKHEPEKALPHIEQLYRHLLIATGRVLPTELQERVRAGQIQEQDAREITRARAEAQRAQQRQQQTEAERVAEQAAQQQREFQRDFTDGVTAVDEWAKAHAGSDPDWSTKQTLVAEQFELECHRAISTGNPPKNRKDAVALAEKALKSVEDRLKTFAPKPKALSVVQGNASPRMQAEPKNAVEAAKYALANMQR